MNRLIVFLALALTSWHCTAAMEYYWVLGSYAVESNATNEQVRLAELLKANVIVKLEPETDTHRVMVNASEVTDDSLVSNSIEAWLLPVSVPDNEIEADAAVKQDIETEPELPEPDEPVIDQEETDSETLTDTATQQLVEREPELPKEFMDGETLRQYCARLPGTRLCHHPAIAVLLKREHKLKEQTADLEGWCQPITESYAKAVCRNFMEDDRVDDMVDE